MSAAAKRRKRAGGLAFEDGLNLGALEFTPPQHVVDIVSRTGVVYAIWKRGQDGHRFYSIHDLPSALVDPEMLFICSPPEATRRAYKLLQAHFAGNPH